MTTNTRDSWRFIYDEFDRPVISPHISLAEGLERYPMECLNAMLKALRTKIPKDPQAKKASIVQRLNLSNGEEHLAGNPNR